MTNQLMNELLKIKPEATIEDLYYYSRETESDRELILTRAINRTNQQRIVIAESKNKYTEISKKIWK